MDWNIIQLIRRSEYRKNVFLCLKDGNKTPKEIADKTKYQMSNVSRELSKLMELSVVECLTPSLKRGRLYRLTTYGKQILEKIE